MRRAHSTLRLGAALASAALALTACGARGNSSSGEGSDAPGITDSKVLIGSSYPLSGPLAANGTAAMGGAKSYIDSVNAKGGVKMSDGKTRKIEFKYYDDGYDPARTVQNYKKLTTRENVFEAAGFSVSRIRCSSIIWRTTPCWISRLPRRSECMSARRKPTIATSRKRLPR